VFFNQENLLYTKKAGLNLSYEGFRFSLQCTKKSGFGKHFQDLEMRAIDSPHRKAPQGQHFIPLSPLRRVFGQFSKFSNFGKFSKLQEIITQNF
jgi:hypothetical protein